jgi:hypothetical protein
MDLDEIYGHFCDQSPLTAMARVALEHAVQDDLLDQLFREHAKKQYKGDSLFSAVVRLMLLAVVWDSSQRPCFLGSVMGS